MVSAYFDKGKYTEDFTLSIFSYIMEIIKVDSSSKMVLGNLVFTFCIF